MPTLLSAEVFLEGVFKFTIRRQYISIAATIIIVLARFKDLFNNVGSSESLNYRCMSAPNRLAMLCYAFTLMQIPPMPVDTPSRSASLPTVPDADPLDQ